MTLAVALVLTAGSSFAGEFRRLSLVNGREVVGEVLASGERGMELAVPQGTMRVAFSEVLTMTAATEADWAAQAVWRVLIAPVHAELDEDADDAVEADRTLRAALARLPHVVLLPSPPPAEAFGLRACALDVGCARSAVAARDFDVLVIGLVGRSAGAEELAVASIWRDAPAATRRASVLGTAGDAPFAEPAEVDAAARAVLGLVPMVPGELAAAPSFPPPAARAVAPDFNPALVYVPLPGFAAFAAGRPDRGIAALAVALPMSGALVWASGATADEPGEAVALGVGGFLLSSIVANAITAPR